MRVLITVNTSWNVWNFRRPLVEALIGAGHDVTILAPRDDTVVQLEGLGCKVMHLEMSVKGLNPFKDAGLVARFYRIFRKVRPDLVLGFTIKNNIFGAVAAGMLRIPFIPNVTGLGTAFLSGGMLRRLAVGLHRYGFRGLDVVFFQNADDRALFMNRSIVTGDQARLLPGSGIDLLRFAAESYPDDGDGPVFLMIARLLRDKGVLEYLEAAKAVRENYPHARFQLLGATGAANRTAIDQTTVDGWHSAGHIEYLGTTDDVRPVIKSASCVVLPSYREGAPRTLIEAAAMARPLIATDVPGCRDVVVDGETGFLCEVRSGESLAAACERFLALTQPERSRMGLEGRKRMQKIYDQRHVVDAYLAAIRDVVPAGRALA